MLFAAALFIVQVGSAVRAKAPAVAAADYLHGKGEVHLFGKDIRKEKAVAFEERDFGVIEVEMELLIMGNRGHRAIEKVEIAADLLDHRVEATRTHQLDTRVQVPVDADLPIHQLCHPPDFQ